MNNSPDMSTIFRALPYGRFIEIQSNLRIKKRLRTNHGFNFLGGSFSNRDNVRESQPSILKADSSSRIDPSIFTSIAPV